MYNSPLKKTRFPETVCHCFAEAVFSSGRTACTASTKQWHTVFQRAVRRVGRLLEMIRFSHTLFALPFAMLAAMMAWTVRAGEPNSGPFFRMHELLGILACMVAARSAAMAFNRLVDRRIDAANPRTKDRHLPGGRLSVPTVATFTIVCSVAFVAATLLFLPNWLPVAFSVPVLAFLLGYSLAKRFTALAHFWLGTALMLSPIAAWVAIRGDVLPAHPADALPAVILAVSVLLWVAGFDIVYACLDVRFDRNAGLHSIPARLGVPAALRLAAVCHAGMVAALAALPSFCPQLGLGAVYGFGIVAIGALLVFEHRLVRPDDLTRVNVAFFHVNVVVSLGLFVVGSIDLLV